METLDASVLADLQATAGADFVAELVTTFAEEAPQMLADLRSASAGGDGDLFRRAAHSLKSNSATFGAVQVARLARELELGGLAVDRQADMAAIDAVEQAFHAALAELQVRCRG